MMRATHVNQTLTVWLLILINTMTFSIYLFFAPIIALIADADHHASFLTRFLKFKMPFKHRWFTHTLVFVLLMMFLFNVILFTYQNFDIILNKWNPFTWDTISAFLDWQKINNMYLFILFHGHLLWDFFTTRWIPYFYPIFKWSVWIPLFSCWEWKNWNITGEMYVNFLHSVMNIWLLSFIILSWSKFAPVIEPVIHWLKETNNISILLWLIFAEILFIIILFWSDIKKYTHNSKIIIKSIFKTLIHIFLWISILFLSFFLINLTWINLTNIVLEVSNQSINIPNLNLIVLIWIFITVLWFSIFWIKKYLISLSSIIAYVINVTYIFLTLSLFIIF